MIQSDQDPCSAEIMPPWLHFAFCMHADTVQYGMDVVCLSHFPVVCVKESFPCACMMHTCRSTRYSTAGSYFFFSFVTPFAGLSCTRTASLPGCAKPKVIVCANGISLETKKNNNSQQSQCNSEKHKVQPKKTSTRKIKLQQTKKKSLILIQF